eukprot:Colp12_sorted_trinity150504_noHs@33666
MEAHEGLRHRRSEGGVARPLLEETFAVGFLLVALTPFPPFTLYVTGARTVPRGLVALPRLVPRGVAGVARPVARGLALEERRGTSAARLRTAGFLVAAFVSGSLVALTAGPLRRLLGWGGSKSLPPLGLFL